MTKEEKEERERDLWSMYHDENGNLLDEIDLESEPISIDEEMKRLYPNKKLQPANLNITNGLNGCSYNYIKKDLFIKKKLP